MPRIFDNIELQLVEALNNTLPQSNSADFCVGYFNLRGWREIGKNLEHFTGGEKNECRLLVGMQRMPQDSLQEFFDFGNVDKFDQGKIEPLKKKIVREFKEQLTFGAPTNEDEAALRRLASQIKKKKIVINLFLRHPLHAKLYLLHREDPNNPTVGFVGSSNLTLAGLLKQGELNVDVLDHDACIKLQKWFDERWEDRFCIDISETLVKVIEESWARETVIPPYHIYLKIAYHLSQEAIAGLHEFKVPPDFKNILFDFQTAAVQIGARYLYKRNGLLIGDVVGLGKTLMATAICKIFEEDYHTEVLIICPKNLEGMWIDYKRRYRLLGEVLSVSRVIEQLPHMPRHRVVLIDESHNLRNREGQRFKAIQEYIQKNDSRCIMLSATPYNKTYLDLSGQLRLFIAEDQDLGIRPERKIRELGEVEFERQHQCKLRSIAAFEKSEYTDDWRELMRLYMLRRTRSFIMDNYAATDPENGLKYLCVADGTRRYFPERIPKTVKFKVRENDDTDPYGRLFSTDVIDVINHLELPRYGLGNYVVTLPQHVSTNEARIIAGLSRAGKRLMGFCRTNLLKRLESGGPTFIQSLERHVLRNFVYSHAIENGLEIPLGSQDPEMLDSRMNDEDENSLTSLLFDVEQDDENGGRESALHLLDSKSFIARAKRVYEDYTKHFRRRFKWIRSDLFIDDLKNHLEADSMALIGLLQKFGEWDQKNDVKLDALYNLLTKAHPDEKVLVFTQFADTVEYLVESLCSRGLESVEAVTGNDENPTRKVWRFSPKSNGKDDPSEAGHVIKEEELRVLVTTDVLSEGQNLQDCYIVVNYDLPWAIIRLIQRAGRVDRIGQGSEKIWCYSFLPARGIERIIHLRARVRQRLRENMEVVGADEAFFEDFNEQRIIDLYNEKSGALDDEVDTEVDPASYAYQIWKKAIDEEPALQRIVEDLPDVVYSTKKNDTTGPDGVLVYMRTAEGHDSMVWVDSNGGIASESPLKILDSSKAEKTTPAEPRQERHHELVAIGARHAMTHEKLVGGQLGSPRGARFRTYDRLKEYRRNIGENRDLFISDEYVADLERVIDDIYRIPLRSSAVDTLNRVLRTGITDYDLGELSIRLRNEDRLNVAVDKEKVKRAHIICSLGLVSDKEGNA